MAVRKAFEYKRQRVIILRISNRPAAVDSAPVERIDLRRAGVDLAGLWCSSGSQAYQKCAN